MTAQAKIAVQAIDNASLVMRKIRGEMRMLTQPIRDIRKSMHGFAEAAGLKDMANGFGKIARTARSVAGGVTKIVAPMAALVGAGTLAGIAELTNRWGQLGISVLRTSQNIGVAPGKLQALSAAARLAGLSSEEMTSSLGALGNTLEDALYGRNQKALYMLRQLGIQIHRTSTGAVDSTRALMDLSGVLQRYNGKPQVQQQIADSFGVGSMLPLLRQGPAAIRAFEAEARRLGAVLSGPELQRANQLGLSFLRMRLGIDGLRNSISDGLFPVLTPLIDQFTSWVSVNRQLIGQAVAEWVGKLVRWLRAVDWRNVWGDVLQVARGIRDVATSVNSVAQALGGWKNTIELMFGAWALGKVTMFGLAVAKVVKAIRSMRVPSVPKPGATPGVGAGAGAGEGAAAGAAGGWLARIAPWARLGVGVGLMTYSPSLDRGEGRALKARMARGLFPQLEKSNHLPHGLLDAVWAQESGRGRHLVSPAGALGDFQFMPSTARSVGLKNPMDFRSSAGAAASMYRNLLGEYHGNLSKALAAYNWGSGNLNRDMAEHGENWLAYAPKETQGYVRNIQARMAGVRDANRFAAGSVGAAPAQRVDVHIRMTGAPHGTRVEARDEQGREVPARIGYNWIGVT